MTLGHKQNQAEAAEDAPNGGFVAASIRGAADPRDEVPRAAAQHTRAARRRSVRIGYIAGWITPLRNGCFVRIALFIAFLLLRNNYLFFT